MVVVVTGGSAGQTRGATLQHADRGPRRDGKRDGDGEQHRRRGTDRNRPHVGPHESTNEGHGQNRRNHRQSGEDRRVADFVDSFERDLVDRFFVGTRQPDVAHDVFDDDDRVIHQDPDREDQREERDAVQRVAVEVENEERERERRGDREEDDERFPPAEEKQNQNRDAKDRDAHVQQELVALLGGRMAVVARDRHGHIRRQQRAPQRGDFGEHRVDDVDGVGPGTFRETERDGGIERGGAPVTVEHIIGRLLGGVGNRGDVAQVDGTSLHDADHDRTEIGGVAQETPGLQEKLGIGEGPRTDLGGPVGLLQHGRKIRRAELAGGQRGGIDRDAHHPARAADERGLGDLRNRFYNVVHLGGETPEREVVVRRTVQRER